MRFLLICLAGAVGSGLRYLVVEWAERWGVLAVNIVGSFLIAIVGVVATSKAGLSENARLAATAGFLGGFTTYSSFNQETLKLIETRTFALAAVYACATFVACLLAGAAGAFVARRFW